MSFVSKFLRPIISEQKKTQETPAVTTTTVKAPVVETPVVEAAVVEATVEETPVVESTVEETPVVEATVEETPVVDAAVEEAPVVEAPVVETPVVEAAVEEAPIEENTVEEAPVVEAAVEETPVVEATVEEAPIEENTVEETPVVESTVEESPIEENTVEETPVVESTVEEAPIEENTVEETPVVEAAVEETPVENSPTIRSLFEKKNITIESSTKKPVVNSIFALSNIIANSYAQSKPLIHCIRDCITKKNFSFTFCVKSFPLAQQQKMEELAFVLEKHGILSGVYVTKKTFIIGGKISTAPNVINFITGDFLEIFTRGVITNVLKTSAEMYNCDYELLTNVNIETITGEKHELDAVIRLGENLFIIEAKSGKFDPDHYRKVGLALGFIPDKLLLLAADKATDLCASIAYFYEYYTANVETFKSTLIAMINHNMSNN